MFWTKKKTFISKKFPFVWNICRKRKLFKSSWLVKWTKFWQKKCCRYLPNTQRQINLNLYAFTEKGTYTWYTYSTILLNIQSDIYSSNISLTCTVSSFPSIQNILVKILFFPWHGLELAIRHVESWWTSSIATYYWYQEQRLAQKSFKKLFIIHNIIDR